MSTVHYLEKLVGVVERITFHNPVTGWSVLKVTPFNDPSKVETVLIHQVKVFAGASMEFIGQWITHQRFGEQFKAERAIEKKPASTAALEKYLGSGLIRGVGPKTARKIVKHFGPRTLDVFEQSIDELLEVPSIASKKLFQIKESWQEHKSIRDVMIFLQSYGISTLFAVKIFKAYGSKAIETVSSNPYRLARDIYGIGFFSADKIALAMGFKEDGEQRIQAGIKHILAGSREEGHCYLFKDQIIKGVSTLLKLNRPCLIKDSIDYLQDTEEVLCRQIPLEDRLVDCYYSKTLYWDEDYVVKKIFGHLSQSLDVNCERVEKWVNSYCEKFNVQLSDEQTNSVIGIVQNPLSILTGGPGCGKTTTIKVLVKLLAAMQKKIVLSAPTGRAAQRMSEVIGMEARTIHRLLEWEPQKAGFKKGEEDPLNCNFVIVDECSMLDIQMTASLLKAIPTDCQLLFIGDPDQLPSVGAGALLQDLLSSEIIPKFTLTKVFRQAEESLIIKHAHDINKGIFPQIVSPLHNPSVWNKSVDCLFIDSEEATQEQLKFIVCMKRAINQTLEANVSYQVQEGGKVTGILSSVGGEIKLEKLLTPKVDLDEDIMASAITIPEKFKHIDIEKFAKTVTGIEELKEIVKQLHPWSTLHYNMSAIDSILRLYTQTIKKKLGKNCEIQILTPQVRGSLGTINLNEKIQQNVNPFKEGNVQIKIGDRFYRVGDRVIQTRNNYDLNVFNGDIGKIININPEDYSTEVIFGKSDRTVTYRKEDLTELKLAYAITIHKSQGSEFDAVIIPISTQHFKMLYRNLIYTGLTRAKKLVVFVGSRKAFARAIKGIDNRSRQTAVKYLLDSMVNSAK